VPRVATSVAITTGSCRSRAADSSAIASESWVLI
jgi:hypothetical protein